MVSRILISMQIKICMKIGIIGVGRMGSAVAMLSLMRFKPAKLILIDVKDLSGDILDLQHAANGLGIKTKFSTKWERADVYVLCAGKARDKNNKAMAMLWEHNRPIVDSLIPKLKKYAKAVIVSTNPSDVVYNYLRSSGINAYSYESILSEARGRKKSGWHIIRTKGYTNFGPATAAVKLMERIL